jgi:hypothetical protein
MKTRDGESNENVEAEIARFLKRRSEHGGWGQGIQVVYHTATKRYLMTAHRGAQGTLGIFDAPEPWGPWTTVACYDNWLELKGSGAKREMLFINIPTKWISADGKTLCVIFTGGQDRFNLVKGTLSLK